MKLKDAKVRYVKKEESKPVHKGTKTGRMSIYSEGYKGEFYNIPISKLYPFKSQARQFFDSESIEALASTIKKHGIRQPLTVIPSDDKEGYYEIVSGERRYRAAMQLGLKTVPCIILHDRNQAEEIALIENIQRKDLHPIELMRGYLHLMDKGICNSMQEIADKLGQSKSSIVDIMNLRNLAPEIQQMLISRQIKSRDFFRSLCKADPKDQENLVLNFNNKEKDVTSKARLNPKKAKRPAPVQVQQTPKKELEPAKVLNITYEKEKFVVDKDRLRDLSYPQKIEIRELLSQIMDEIL